MKKKTTKSTRTESSAIGRRDMMKLGVGAGAGTLMGQLLDVPPAAAQGAQRGGQAGRRSVFNPEAWNEEERYAGVKMETGPGWKNDANRAFGNGPMDTTTRIIVDYVKSFSEKNLTEKVVAAFANTMIDTIASMISGFESEPVRICARLARTTRSDLKSTVFGYGIVTSPELAAYANSSMIRHTDFNDHASDMMGGILAVGEALHSSGTQLMMGIVLAYQINSALGGAGSKTAGLDAGLYYAPAAAAGIGKLMGLNEDQLANTISLAITLHVPLRVDRTGVLSMQKGCSTADAARSATFCALAAREGMTGPARPFEGRDGLWDRLTGPYTDLRLPPTAEPGTGLANAIKRSPAEGYTQSMHADIIPQIRAWTKAENIAAIHIEMPFSGWLEIADPPKWDPRNRETADHSMAYEAARALIDGEIYVDSFTQEKIMEPAVRNLMQKITVSVNPDYPYGMVKMTVRNNAGAEIAKETQTRNGLNFGPPMTHDDIIAKYRRICEFMHVNDAQRDHALAQWSDLRSVKDIADAIQTLATFGRPRPL